MSLDKETYITGIGSVGVVTGAIDTIVRCFIPGKKGSRININTLHCQTMDTQTTREYMVFMKPLGRTQVTAAGTAAGTSGFTITTASFAYGDSIKNYGIATDSVAANNWVAIHLTNGTWEYDQVEDVATTGYITLDTALTGIANIGDQVYFLGTDTHEEHSRVALSTGGKILGGDSYADVASCDEKGDPMFITNNPTSSTGTLAGGTSITALVYTYVNK